MRMDHYRKGPTSQGAQLPLLVRHDLTNKVHCEYMVTVVRRIEGNIPDTAASANTHHHRIIPVIVLCVQHRPTQRLRSHKSGTLEFTWQAGEGQEKQSIHSAKAAFITQLPKTERGTVTLTNLGEGAIEAAIITRTRPVEDTLPAQSNGLGIKVQYADAAGRPIAPADGIRQGSDITATVTISNLSATQDYSHLALTHLLPSGWEIQGERADTGNASAGYDYRDIRDDRVLTYFSLQRGQQKHFTLHLQATYAGTFTLPAVQCEDMYDPSVMARTQAGKTSVKK